MDRYIGKQTEATRIKIYVRRVHKEEKRLNERNGIRMAVTRKLANDRRNTIMAGHKGVKRDSMITITPAMAEMRKRKESGTSK